MPSQTTSTGAAYLLNRNRLRKSVIVFNEDTTDAVFLKRERAATPTVSATDHDIKIGPGSFWGMSSTLDGVEAIQDSYSVISAANTPRVSYFESEDVLR
jgi:hypothetical protein